MKYLNYLIIAFTLSCIVMACTKKETSVIWDTPLLEDFDVTPIPGGAIVVYTLPKDPDLLYIQAEYLRDGKVFTEKSSIYNDTLKIRGFNVVEEVTAKLYKVNRKGEMSEPSPVTFTPQTPVVKIALDSATTAMTFGGVNTKWVNISGEELGVHIISKDSTGKFVKDDFYFSSEEKGAHVFRGYESKETEFGIYFEDAWGNNSDTILFTGQPLFEKMIEKPYIDFRKSIPYDNITDLAGATHVFSTLYDGTVNTSGHGWLSQNPSNGNSITFDIGKPVRLSRIVIHGYHVNAPYGQVNITEWEGWGAKEIDFNKLADKPYWLDEFNVKYGLLEGFGIGPNTKLPENTFEDDWEYLGRHHIVRYDQMVPPQPDMVTYISENGSEYIMPVDIGPVRYIRIFPREVAGTFPPPPRNYFSMGEITFYGDDNITP